MTDFDGFPKRTLTFLRGVARNNDRGWFQAHREDYEAYWLAPAKDFVVAAGEALRAFAPDIHAEPRINGSIFRINRDIRFSQDKRPYKDHLDFWFWEGERKQAISGYFLRVTPKTIDVGAGAHMFDRDRLASYRDAVVDAESGRALISVVRSMERRHLAVKGEHYKRPPRGYQTDDPVTERLLRHSALWIGEEEPVPDQLHTGAIVKHVASRWKRMAPLHRWLVDTLG